MTRRRLRKWAKWTCTLAAGAAVALAVFSRFVRCWDSFATNNGNTEWMIGLEAGQLSIERTDGWLFRNDQASSGWYMEWNPHWRWGYSGEGTGHYPWLEWHSGVLWYQTAFRWTFGASLLYPALLTSLPAALLWYIDRRRFGPGLCPTCGYDRTGLAADAKCPECGTVPAPAVK
jgi:hypothetical protein